jgi:hypothetical protein
MFRMQVSNHVMNPAIMNYKSAKNKLTELYTMGVANLPDVLVCAEESVRG